MASHIPLVEDVEVAFVLPRSAGDVEARLRAGAREGHVGPFLQPCFAGAEDEGTVDGEALDWSETAAWDELAAFGKAVRQRNHIFDALDVTRETMRRAVELEASDR